MAELSNTARQWLVDQMLPLVSHTFERPDFEFVLVVRTGDELPYVFTDVPPKRARAMLREALHHPDMSDRPKAGGLIGLLALRRWSWLTNAAARSRRPWIMQ